MGNPMKFAIGAGVVACCAGTLLGQGTASKIGGQALSFNAALSFFLPRAPTPQIVAAVPRTRTYGNEVSLAPDRSGHYRADVEVFGRRIRMLVDTGATIVALTSEDADALGVRPMPADYQISLSTANGMVQAAAIRLSQIRIGTIAAQDVAAVVMPPGVMQESLLGMSFLRRLGGFEVADGKLILKP
jgi:aspartyl protease family protein